MTEGIFSMFYTFYKITDFLNHKKYYGIHTTRDLDDGYMGSGSKITDRIRSHGKQWFRKEILCLCENEAEMIEIERLFVNHSRVSDPNCYNKCLGGNYGITSIPRMIKRKTYREGKNFSQTTKNRMNRDIIRNKINKLYYFS